MEKFTGWQYMLIDLANAYGLDKELFGDRIQWAEAHLPQLENMVEEAETKPLFVKAMQAIRKVQRGEPTGHVIGFDACCSGIQVMSALTGCLAGATNTGLVNPNVRADAYTMTTSVMEGLLGGTVHVDRKGAKLALMTSFYGSKKEPINIFGADTPELNAFYQAANVVAPGAWELLQDLLASWQPYALEHHWKLPDGFDARVKVMEKKEARIEVDELDHATFTYEFYENTGTKSGLSNVANVVHSVDAYVLRCIHRRCNYDKEMVEKAMEYLYEAKDDYGHGANVVPHYAGDLLRYIDFYKATQMADVVIFPLLNEENVQALTEEHIDKLIVIGQSMLQHKPFPVVTIHDEFKCGPNHMNHLRQHYINIFAEMADSTMLDDILSQIHGKQGHFTKLSSNLSGLIRGSNYALS